MKRFFLNAALALALVGTAVACKGDKKNDEASVEFINNLTDILHELKINVIEIKPKSKRKEGKYTEELK